jgi:ribosome biogenesis GTPase
LQALGFADWFSSHARTMLQPGQSVARVMTVDRGAYLVRGEQRETPAELSGRFRFAVESSPDLPCVGDWGCVEHASPTLAIIHAVLPRKTFLRRKWPGKTVDFQMIAANLDVAFLVQSCHYDFNIRRLDRYLVVAKEGRIEPVVILSKTDLVTFEELGEMIERMRNAGVTTEILPISNTTGKGLEAFRQVLVAAKPFCLLGSSGVGKTTLINRLLGKDALYTKAVSGLVLLVSVVSDADLADGLDLAFYRLDGILEFARVNELQRGRVPETHDCCDVTVRIIQSEGRILLVRIRSHISACLARLEHDLYLFISYPTHPQHDRVLVDVQSSRIDPEACQFYFSHRPDSNQPRFCG